MEKVIIIGAGPAGISAALYAVRGNLDPLVINNGIGALEKAEKIENYYGLEHPLSGQKLYDTGIAQAKALGVRILDAQVLGVGGFDTFVVKTTEGEFETQSLILATGSKRAAPKIPGVKEFEGKGVSYCAICDAFFYRGKDVAVLGNGDFAMHEAKELSNTASTVTIYTNGEEPEFTPEENISVNTMKIQSVEGDDLVSGIRLAPDVQAEEINGRKQVSRQMISVLQRVYLLQWELQAVLRLPARWELNLRKKATLKLTKIWKQPSRDSMRQVTVQADFFRWRKLYMREHRQVLMQGSM